MFVCIGRRQLRGTGTTLSGDCLVYHLRNLKTPCFLKLYQLLPHPSTTRGSVATARADLAEDDSTLPLLTDVLESAVFAESLAAGHFEPLLGAAVEASREASKMNQAAILLRLVSNAASVDEVFALTARDTVAQSVLRIIQAGPAAGHAIDDALRVPIVC